MIVSALENQDYAQLAEEVYSVVNTKTEDELFRVIAYGLYDSGLEVSPEGYSEATIPIPLNNFTKRLSALESVNFVQDYATLSLQEADKRGRRLWSRIKQSVCSNEDIKKFFSEGGSLKDNLKTLIPIILAMISSTLVLGAIGLAIAVAVIALLLKVGFQSYCEI